MAKTRQKRDFYCVLYYAGVITGDHILTMLKKFQNYYLLLALLVHLLLFLSFSLVIQFPSNALKLDKNIPVYVYHEEKNSPPSQITPKTIPQKEVEVSKLGIEKPATKQPPKPVQTKMETLSVGKGEQNINVTVQTREKMDKPLLDLVTKAAAAHLVYPKIAVDFHLMGAVILGFVLAPDGQVSQLTVLQSSGAEVLDNAALDAIRAAIPIKNVGPYLTKSEPFVFDIVFR